MSDDLTFAQRMRVYAASGGGEIEMTPEQLREWADVADATERMREKIYRLLEEYEIERADRKVRSARLERVSDRIAWVILTLWAGGVGAYAFAVLAKVIMGGLP